MKCDVPGRLGSQKEMGNKALSLLPWVGVCHLQIVVSVCGSVRVAHPTLQGGDLHTFRVAVSSGPRGGVGVVGSREPLERRNMLTNASLVCPLPSVGSLKVY